MPSPWNEIVYNLMLQIVGWMAEEESDKRSKRVKMKLDRSEGITKSTYGKKWGRKKIELDEKKVMRLYKSGMSYRAIGEELNVSHSKITDVIKSLATKQPKQAREWVTLREINKDKKRGGLNGKTK